MKKANNIFAHTDCLSEEMLTKYVSEKLSSAQKHEVEKHLADCEMCSDAAEGLAMIGDKSKISKITSELNQKIQKRVAGKREVKVIFLQQYRTQLAVAASVVILLGLILFFRNTISMKELDLATSEKIFADKFEPPASELDKEEVTGKEQTETEVVGAVDDVAVPPPASIVLLDVAEEKAVVEESLSFSDLENAQGGQDIPKENPAVPDQKAAQLKQAVKAEKKEDAYYWRNRIAETQKSIAAKPEVTLRSENEKAENDELAKVVVTKESSKNKIENNLESLKEKDKKDRDEKQVVTATAPKSVEIVPISGTSAVVTNQPVADKTVLFGKQENKKTADDRNSADTSKANREQSGEGNILAYQTSMKRSKETGYRSKGKKEKAPQKVSGGYFDTKTGAAVPVTESTTIKIETPAANLDGRMADSIFTGIVTLSSNMSVSETALGDDAMVKYDKQDYAGAVNGFEQALKENPNDEKAIFYSAVSYLSLGQTDKALANFNKIMQNKSSKYYDDAQWYSSLAYIKNNDIKNARVNLIQIQNNDNSRYKKQADETLKQIKK